MVNSDNFIQLIAKAYYEAALENVNMQNAIDALESIRKAVINGENHFNVWVVIDKCIGQTEDDRFQKVLIKFRNRFIQQVFAVEIVRLHEAFRSNPEDGWTEWLRVYTEAFTYWRFKFCLMLSEEQFPFPAGTEPIVEKIRQSTRFALHSRWPEVYDSIIYLAEQERISKLQRANMLVTAAEIQLYHLLKPDVAKDLLQRGKELAPGESRVIIGWGEYWLQKKEFDKAKECFQEVIRQDSILTNGYTVMGECYEKQNDLDAAEEWYIEAIKKRSGDSGGYLRLLRLYGRPEKLATHETKLSPFLNRVIAVDPLGEYIVYIEMGYIYQQNKQYEKAYYWYDKAIELDGTCIGGYTSKGYSYLEENNYEQARASFQIAIKFASEAFDGYWGMALLYERQELWEDALQWYEQSLQKRPSWEGLIQGKIGEIKLKQRQYKEAENELFKALRCDPDNQRVLHTIYNLASDLIIDNENATFRVYDEIRQIIGESYEAEYHSKLSKVYKQLKDWANAREEIDLAYQIDKNEDTYRNEMAHIFNAEGNECYSQTDYSKAIEKYEKAIEFDPKDAIIHSNLAGAWEKLKDPGRRVEALSNAISALRKAHELNPDDREYIEKLPKLQRKKSIGEHFGEKALEMWPVVTPIAVEFASNLIPYVKSETETEELHPTLNDLIVNMREDIKTKGVKVPGIRFRDNEDLPEGTYNIMINEIPLDKGTISEEKRLFPGTMENLTPLGVFGEETDNPLTGDEAVWIFRKDWEKVERAGHSLWEVIEYIVRHLEAVIRRNLSEFLGHQELVNMCKQMEDTSSILSARMARFRSIFYPNLTALTTVFKGLLNEGVPIIEFEKIVTKFNQLKKDKKDILTIIETIRSIPEVHRTLPGNNDQYSFYPLGRRFEEEIKQSISIEDYQPILTMKPENVQDALTAVREQAGSNRNVAILVENAELRPFVRQLIELEFPLVPVLSRRELLPGLEGKIKGEIELEQQDEYLNNNYKRYQKGEEIWEK